MLAALALLLQSAVTVGDTVWVERLVGVAAGAVVRPQAWSLGTLGRQLGPAEVRFGIEGAVVRYGLVLWYPGDHTLTMPGPVLVRRDGRSDTLAASPVRIQVRSVLPTGVPRADITPRPATAELSLASTTLLPLAVLSGLTLTTLGIAAWRWRRRGPVPPKRNVPVVRPEPEVLARWAAAGEYRAALEGWGWILARRLRDSVDLEETAALQKVLEEISYTAFAPKPPGELAALADRAARLAAT
ncbi:MAG: hypothetical protein HOP28_04105 [Gemmatimonadales bacterium]|nr:hypothetical protein [Gemmatimonadales bacterium]